MYSCLVVALFAALSLFVSASPLPSVAPSPTLPPTDDCLGPTPTQTDPCSEPTVAWTVTPTDDCPEPTITPPGLTPVVAPSATPTDDCSEPSPTVTPTDDCSESTTIPPTPTTIPMTTSPVITPSSTPSVTPTNSVPPTPLVMDYQSNGPFTDGVATYYYQDGNPGACGWYNSDNDIICAMDQSRFGTGDSGPALCGKKVHITNMKNNSTIIATIVDDCPTCDNKDSIDLSVSAFQLLEPDLDVGEFSISWYYI